MHALSNDKLAVLSLPLHGVVDVGNARAEIDHGIRRVEGRGAQEVVERVGVGGGGQQNMAVKHEKCNIKGFMARAVGVVARNGGVPGAHGLLCEFRWEQGAVHGFDLAENVFLGGTRGVPGYGGLTDAAEGTKDSIAVCGGMTEAHEESGHCDAGFLVCCVDSAGCPGDVDEEGVVAGLVDDRVPGGLADNIGVLGLLLPGKTDGVFEEEVKPLIKRNATVVVVSEDRLDRAVVFSRSKVWKLVSAMNSSQNDSVGCMKIRTYSSATAQPSPQAPLDPAARLWQPSCPPSSVHRPVA